MEKLLFSSSNGIKKRSIAFLHWSSDGTELLEMFLVWTHLAFETRLSP